MSQWSGPLTILWFFASLRIVALILSLLMVLARRTKVTITLAAANLALSVPVALVGLRREEMIDVSLAIAGALWFGRKISIPLPLIAAGGVGLAMVVFSIGALRSASNEIYLSTGRRPFLFSMELIEAAAFRGAAGEGVISAPDIRNAIHIIEYTDRRGTFAFGGNTWNDVIHQWVPGQIVGHGFKRSLMVDGWRTGTYDAISDELGFTHIIGTTTTGFGSAYQDFGYFGSLYYWAIGSILGAMFRRAKMGDPWYQALFLAGTTFALICITHVHSKLFVMLPLFLVVVFGLRWVVGDVSIPGAVRRRRVLQARPVGRRSLAMPVPLRPGSTR